MHLSNVLHIDVCIFEGLEHRQFLNSCLLVVKLLSKPIRVNHLLVDPTLNVDKTMVKLFVLVCLDILELLQLVDPNVSLAQNVLKTKPVIIKNA
jgi:hypothetical protein